MWTLILSLLLAGAAVPGPAENLLYDVRRIAASREPSPWRVDAYAIDERMPDALQSVCRTDGPTRSAALATAEQEVARLGGPLELALESEELRELDELVDATRVAKLLEAAVERAPEQCPPWLSAEPDFAALQGGIGRFFLSLEAGSSDLVQHAARHPDGTTGWRVADGGGVRLLVGRGFDPRVSARAGLEVGVSQLSRADESGAAEIPWQLHGAAPIVLRYGDVSSHMDLEVAPLAAWIEGEPGWRAGGRVGVAAGISRLRDRSVIPWVGVGATVDWLPGQVTVRYGLRGGVDWDLGRR